MDVVVSNLVNTMYCRDAGKKLRTANQVKWRKGITTASAAPFGYQFDPDKRAHLSLTRQPQNRAAYFRMVLGKTKTLISGKSIIRTVPKGQRYITEGTHEAIVSRRI